MRASSQSLTFQTSRGKQYHLLTNCTKHSHAAEGSLSISPALSDKLQPAYFLLHGFLGNAEDWLSMLAHFPSDIPWYAIDLFGHGFSERSSLASDYQPNLLYQDMAELLTYFSHTPQDSWLGYSMGGRLLLGTALYANPPLRHQGPLVLMGSHFGLQTEEARIARKSLDGAWAEKLRRDFPSFLKEWYQQPLLSRQPPRDPEAHHHWLQRRLRNNPESLALFMTQFSPALTTDTREDLARLERPVLLMSGEKDTRYTEHYKEIVEILPNAHHIVLPDCGHTLPIEDPLSTAQSCLKFLNNLPYPPASHAPTSTPRETM